MIRKDREIVDKLKKRLADKVPLLELKVFGSRARGDADLSSDLDVFIEVEEMDEKIRETIEEIVWEVGYDNYRVISPLIFTRDEIENSPLRASPILKSINEEGIRI